MKNVKRKLFGEYKKFAKWYDKDSRSAGHILSPSWRLLNDYKNGKIDWAVYVKTFYREMDNPACVAIMREDKRFISYLLWGSR